jgi:hypothetical protein
MPVAWEANPYPAPSENHPLSEVTQLSRAGIEQSVQHGATNFEDIYQAEELKRGRLQSVLTALKLLNPRHPRLKTESGAVPNCPQVAHYWLGHRHL